MIIKNSYKRGRISEGIALCWLYLKGYHLLEQRYRNKAGEIDLLMRKGRKLIAVEIKFRSTLEHAAFCLRLSQQQRIERTLKGYIARLNWQPEEIRFDVILMAPFCWPYHVKNAWQTEN